MKTKPTLRRLALAALIVATSSSQLSTAHAQGTAFTYQGRLNAGSAPATGSYDLTFALFATVTNGAAIAGPITNTATAVSNGLFTVTMDFGNQFPGAARWLEIGVRTNGGGAFSTLAPRQAMTPAPYSITAGSVVSGGLTTGTYGNAVTFSNGSNSFTGSFSGNGGGLTNVNAATLNGLTSANLWKTGGNSLAPGQFLGSTNNQPLELWVNNLRVGQLAYASNLVSGYSPNVVLGNVVNFVSNNVVGATISGGGGGPLSGTNQISGDFATIAGGSGNIAAGTYSFAEGNQSFAFGYESVAMGSSTASGDASTASGFSSATTHASTAMGISSANGAFASAMGNATANGDYATAMGKGMAQGNYSFAAGGRANANGDGAFVWADSQDADFNSTGTNQFCIRAQGGVILDNSTPAINFGNQTRQMLNLWNTNYGIGVQNSTEYFRTAHGFAWFLGGTHSDTENDPGGGSIVMILNNGGLAVNGTFVSASDRNLKENFKPVSAEEVLDKVAGLPISRWNYKQDHQSEHLGPMAQDFYAAFNIGPDDKHIAVVDESGVALAAIQGLNQKLNEKDVELQNLKRQNESLSERLEGLEATVKQLAAQK